MTRQTRNVSARASAAAPSNGAASAPNADSNVFPLDSAGLGWDAVELHKLTGLAWTFTTPSSTDGRKIVKHAAGITEVSLKGSSNWRKEDWELAAEKSDVKLLDTFSTLPGMRGFRACWAPDGIALLYVPGVRRFYTMRDVETLPAIDEKADKPSGGVTAALVALCRVKSGFSDAFKVATSDELSLEASTHQAKAAHERQVSLLAAKQRNNIEYGGTGEVGGERGASQSDVHSDSSGNTSAPEPPAPPPTYKSPQTAVARWCMGLGVDAAQLHAEFAVGFDFHGPAGSVMRDVIVSAAETQTGETLTSEETSTWAKQEWVDAMERFGIVQRQSHANVNALGRSWKVCWVSDAVEINTPAVFLWVPERNAYFTLGSLAAAGSSVTTTDGNDNTPPCAVESAIRAVVGVAKSTPAPPGLKHALTRDCDFLTLLGRKPKDVNAPVSVGTTGGADAARAADASVDHLSSQNETVQDTADDFQEFAPSPEAGDDAYDEGDSQTSVPSTSNSIGNDSDDSDDSDYFRPAPELGDFEWADSREGLRRRPDRDDDGEFDPQRDLVNPSSYTDAPMSVPGFEDIPGMEGFVADEDVTGQGEFFSRSAGYLSFVDGSWSKEDLAREMGLDRQDINDPPVTPRDFPDLSEVANVRRLGGEDVDVAVDSSDQDDFKELIPNGLPKPFESYNPLRLHGCDYLVTRMNDGRLDFRDVMVAHRKEDGNFVGEAQRVDTSSAMQIPPRYYHEVAWTERELKKEEKHVSDGGPTEYNTLLERTTKVYLVACDTPFTEEHAFDRRLDFTLPVVVLDNEGKCEVMSINGAKENPNGVLVIREGEMFVEQAEQLPNWESVCHEWEVDRATAQKEGNGPALHEDFLKETEDDYVPDDTPEIDTY